LPEHDAQNAAAMAASDDAPAIRFVAFHQPGPAWAPGVAFFEQASVQAHVMHYARALSEGHLESGGPFLDSSGGMMVFMPGLERPAVEEIALRDPAVRSGLLTVEIKPWLAALSR
jgi:uncharacterized protein YciI